MIKKTFGILIFILGLIIENIGLGAIAYSNGQLNTYDGQIQQELFDHYMREHDESQIMGSVFIGVGLLLLIIGLILIGTKTKAQREKEIELKLLKSIHENGKVA